MFDINSARQFEWFSFYKLIHRISIKQYRIFFLGRGQRILNLLTIKKKAKCNESKTSINDQDGNN